SLSGADPLNLVGIITPGPRLPALTGNRLLYRDGLPIALLAAGDVQFLETLDAASEWEAHKALLRCAEPAPSTASDTALPRRNGIAFRRHHRPGRASGAWRGRRPGEVATRTGFYSFPPLTQSARIFQFGSSLDANWRPPE